MAPHPVQQAQVGTKTYTHTVAMIQNLVVPYLGKKQIQKVQTYDLEQFYACLLYTSRCV